MRNVFLSICILIINLVYCQNSNTLHIQYVEKKECAYNEFDKEIIADYLYSGEKSLYTQHKKMIDPEKATFDENGEETGPLKDYNVKLYKDFQKNIILSWFIMYGQKIIKDNGNLFDWKITNNKKTILGHECIEATTDFRGKSWIVYYSADIPVSDGPWKFNGLPGMILQVKDKENLISFEATSIEYLANPTEIISGKLDEVKAITFEECIVGAKKHIKAIMLEDKISDPKSNGSVRFDLNCDQMEIYDLNSYND